jgi:hypothetical protein
MYNPPLVSNAMVEKIVTVGNTEVQIEETEDGFEVTEVFDPDPGTVEHFRKHAISEGDTIWCGRINSIEQQGDNHIRVYVDNPERDIMRYDTFDTIHGAGYEAIRIEWEYGEVDFQHRGDE